MYDSKNFAKLVKEARVDKGLSARQLAKLCDVSHTEINNIEKGARVKPALLVLKGFEKYLDLDFKTIAKMVGYSDEAIDYAEDEIIISFEKYNKKLDEFSNIKKELLFEIDKRRHLGLDLKENFDVVKDFIKDLPDVDPDVMKKIDNMDKLFIDLNKEFREYR